MAGRVEEVDEIDNVLHYKRNARMVFGLFRKKPDNIKLALEAAYLMLHTQFQLTSGGIESANLISSDIWALGYVYGFHECWVQALKVTDFDQSRMIMGESYRMLFGSVETVEKLWQQSMDLQDNEAFRQGMLAAAQDVEDFRREKKPPLGLARHLSAKP